MNNNAIGFVEAADSKVELKVVEGADWNREIGALSVLASKDKENRPAILFDRIKGYRAGYRILVGLFESLRRSALTTHLPSTSRVKVSSRLAASGWPRVPRFHRSRSPAGRFRPAAEIEADYQKSLMEKWKKELFS